MKNNWKKTAEYTVKNTKGKVFKAVQMDYMGMCYGIPEPVFQLFHEGEYIRTVKMNTFLKNYNKI